MRSARRTTSRAWPMRRSSSCSALTGFNRVMLYSFDAEGTGTVLAEASDGELPSYLDLRFPASDIPAQARELYRLNRLRLIPTANYTPVRIEPTLKPARWPASRSEPRGAAKRLPIHLQYMRNMGTLGSMSISILVDGALWGLISCHNAAAARRQRPGAHGVRFPRPDPFAADRGARARRPDGEADGPQADRGRSGRQDEPGLPRSRMPW